MSSFRLPADVLAGWKDELASARGSADDALQDILRALQAEGPDGHVVVTRHQLFSWAQAAEGAARKGRPQLQAVADDMRSYLRPGEAAAAFAPPDAAPFVAPVAPAAERGADVPRTSSPARYEPPPVVYQRASAPPAAAQGPSRFVAERDVAAVVQEMLREARSEVIVVSPWSVGLDTLANPLLTLLPQDAVVRALTRRPPQEDEAYHRLVAQMRKRGFDLAFSPHLQTRLIVVDARRLLLGAASLVGPQSREAAIDTTDPALVQAARENALRLLQEARGQ